MENIQGNYVAMDMAKSTKKHSRNFSIFLELRMFFTSLSQSR
jgi:hypothetical protein